MNVRTGLKRLRILWTAICFVPAIAIVVILSFSQHHPDLMVQFSVLSLLIAASLSLPLWFSASLKTILLFAISGAGACAAVFANLNSGQDAIYGEAKPAAFALAGIVLWLVWAAGEWVLKGFLKGDG